MAKSARPPPKAGPAAAGQLTRARARPGGAGLADPAEAGQITGTWQPRWPSQRAGNRASSPDFMIKVRYTNFSGDVLRIAAER